MREAVRVILIDPYNRILLLGLRDLDDGRAVWCVPGGGIEPGETREQAARRELVEELQFAEEVEFSKPVWTRREDFTWDGRSYSQQESFLVARLSQAFPSEPIFPDGQEGTYFIGARWLSREEILAWPHIVLPRRLAELIVPIPCRRSTGAADRRGPVTRVLVSADVDALEGVPISCWSPAVHAVHRVTGSTRDR